MFAAKNLFLAGAIAPKDPYFPYVSLLLPGNGTNGAQNNTFLDSSANAFTITRNGNTTQGTFTPYGSNWSNYFAGTSGQYLNAPANAAFNFGTGDFTVEAWVFPTSTSGTRPIVEVRTAAANATGFALVSQGGATTLNVYTNGAFVGASTNSLTTNAWNHVALVRSGNTWTYWINGVSGGSFTNTSTQSDGATTGPKIGGSTTAGEVWVGYISNVRILKGTALYTSTFTPSITPLTAITNTSLLTCQSNRFIDNSSNAFAITVNGTPSVQRFSPFNPSASYSTSVIGGSGYFDGSGDFLVAPDNAALEPGSSNLTWEMWINTTSSTQYATLYSRTPSTFSTGMWTLMINWASATAGDVALYFGEYSTSAPLMTTSGVNVRDGAWHHIAVVRNGSSWAIYVDGTSRATATWVGSVVDIAGGPYIGADQFYGRNYLGYIVDLRILKGTALYTSTFTPPTTPLTTITNTSLLLNMTNGGVIDNAMMNDLETVGNAQISTAQSKFGGSSVLFNGTTDKCVGRTSPNLNMGSGDFTVECWVYWNGGSTPYQNFVGSNSASFAGNATFFRVWGTSASGGLANKVGIGNPTHDATSSVYSVNSLSTGTWTHVAATRSSGIIRVFINGNLERTGSSDTSTYDFGDNGICVGQSPWDGANGWYNGYIDDLRITKGYARYTASFTPPTQAFPTR